MIRLVVTSTSDSKTYVFDCSSVIVGSPHSLNIELPVDDDLLEDRHIQMIEEKEGWFLINLANDPFATLNDLPFGKRPLNENDVIQIGNTSINVHFVAEKAVRFKPQQSDIDVLNSLLMQVEALSYPEEKAELKLKKTPVLTDETKITASFFTEKNIEEGKEVVDPVSEKEMGATDAVLDLVENENLISAEPLTSSPTLAVSIALGSIPSISLDSEEASNACVESPSTSSLHSESTISESESKPHSQLSLKDYYLREYDDHEDNLLHGISQPNAVNIDEISGRRKIFRWSALFLLFLTFLGGGIFVWVSDKTAEEESNAARVIADVTMALFHAQVKKIHPQNQNWSDVEFIKNNLTAILPPEYSFLAHFDRQGNFIESPYILRIYTSANLSQFLVIAQPSPSLIHWLIPKASIVIDSHAMEIRKIKDLKILNRLLVNASALDDINAAEISTLVKQGELISLSDLISKNHNPEFSPPKALVLTHPHASNLIYNAPRYYFLGQQLIAQALELIQTNSNGSNVPLFMHELSLLSKFPYLILYSAEGIQYAVKAQQALNVLVPEEKFLFGYLRFDPQGNISGAHLLIDDSASEIGFQEPPPGFMLEKSLYNVLTRYEEKNPTHSHKHEASGNEQRLIVETDPLVVNHEDPIFLHLSGLAIYREHMLQPICDDIMTLLELHTKTLQRDFEKQWAQLQNRYMEKDAEQKQETEKHIGIIVRENSRLPALHLIEFIKAANMEAAFDGYLQSIKSNSAFVVYSHKWIEDQLKRIEDSLNWEDLNQSVTQAAKLLQFENIPDQDRLIVYQNMTRSYVTQKLNRFILSYDQSITKEYFTSEYRKVLMHILQIAWIIDSDTCDFYLNEFDQRGNL